MKFAPLLAFVSLISSAVAVYVTSADGTQIWAESTGDPSKPPVVFIPGFSCTSLAFDKQWADSSMKANLFMVRYDVRGQGISGQPLNASAYQSQDFAEDFKAVIDFFGIGDKKPILAGWSMGGVTAADVATYYGAQLMGGVILMGSVPFRSMLSLVATQFALNPTLQLLDPSLADFGPAVKEFVEAFVAYGDKLDQGIKYSWMGAIAGQYPDIRNWSAPHTQNETALMASSRTIPCLVLQGAMDKLLDGEKVRDLMNTYFGNFVFRMWENTGHASFFDNPERANPEIIAFAKRLSHGWTTLSDSPDGAIFPPAA